MLPAVNSKINTRNNTIFASKLSDKDTGSKKLIEEVRAPAFFPSYSVENVIKEQDEFRKSVYLESYKREKMEKRKHTIFSLFKTILYVAGIYLIISKIKFKSK